MIVQVLSEDRVVRPDVTRTQAVGEPSCKESGVLWFGALMTPLPGIVVGAFK
jgi:hypothetical protein